MGWIGRVKRILCIVAELQTLYGDGVTKVVDFVPCDTISWHMFCKLIYCLSSECGWFFHGLFAFNSPCEQKCWVFTNHAHAPKIIRALSLYSLDRASVTCVLRTCICARTHTHTHIHAHTHKCTYCIHMCACTHTYVLSCTENEWCEYREGGAVNAHIVCYTPFELVVPTGELALVTGTCIIAYMSDAILAGQGVAADRFSVWPE